jgi:hypothetical protein
MFDNVQIPNHEAQSHQHQSVSNNLLNVESSSTTAASTLPVNAAVSKSTGHNSSSNNNVVMMMNRRPKINENNIKLIEKVIKR